MHGCDIVSSTGFCPSFCFPAPSQSLQQSPLMKLLRASIPGFLSSKELLEAVGGDGKGLADTGLSPIDSNFELSLLEQELCLGMPEFSWMYAIFQLQGQVKWCCNCTPRIAQALAIVDLFCFVSAHYPHLAPSLSFSLKFSISFTLPFVLMQSFAPSNRLKCFHRESQVNLVGECRFWASWSEASLEGHCCAGPLVEQDCLVLNFIKTFSPKAANFSVDLVQTSTKTNFGKW